MCVSFVSGQESIDGVLENVQDLFGGFCNASLGLVCSFDSVVGGRCDCFRQTVCLFLDWRSASRGTLIVFLILCLARQRGCILSQILVEGRDEVLLCHTGSTVDFESIRRDRRFLIVMLPLMISRRTL